jgi:hypothetical protein
VSWLSKLLGGDPGSRPASVVELIFEARSGDGYRREAAVIALGRLGDRAALPVLLERTNDWVPEVRRAARQSIAGLLGDEHVASWAAALDRVAALHRAARADHSELLGRIEAFLSSPANLRALREARRQMSAQAVRFLFSLELRAAADDETRFQALRHAAAAGDVVVAASALAAIDSLALPIRRHDVAGAACVSGFAAIRAAGLRAALRIGEPATASLARAMCFDRSAGVRCIALAALTGERQDVVDDARRRFDSSPSLRDRAVALDILCTLRPDEASSLCKEARGHASPAVRRVAFVRSLTAADDRERERLVLLALADASPKVQAIAVMQVSRGAAAPPPEVLLRLAQANPAVFSAVLLVSAHLPPWTRIAFLLGMPRGTGSVPLLQRELARWAVDMSRCFVPPSPAQAPAVAGAWSRVCAELPPDLQQRVAAQLRSFGVLGGDGVNAA